MAASPAEVAESAETVLVSLPTPAIVREVALGRNGIIQGGAVRTFVDLSTTGPTVAREVAEALRSEEHTSELQSLMRISYAVFCLKKKTKQQDQQLTKHR